MKDRTAKKRKEVPAAVRLGVATVSTSDGRLSYNWAEIRRLWMNHWPTTNLFAFCAHYDINYKHAREKLKVDLRLKREAEANQGRGRAELIRDMAVIGGYEDMLDQAQRMKKLLGSLEHAAAGCVKYVELNCIKVTDDGVMMANTQATMQQMSTLALIAFRAASTMRFIIEMGRTVGNTEEEDPIAEPTPAPPTPLKLTGT